MYTWGYITTRRSAISMIMDPLILCELEAVSVNRVGPHPCNDVNVRRLPVSSWFSNFCTRMSVRHKLAIFRFRYPNIQ